MGRTALYLRTATMDDIGIESQRTILERWCDENSIENTELFVDEGYSGLKYDRPSFQKLLRDVESGKISTIVITEVSRIGRKLMETNKYLSSLSSKARLIAVNNSVDTSLKPYSMLNIQGGDCCGR